MGTAVPAAVPDFFADANKRLQAEHLTLDPEAEGHIRAIYGRAQHRLERDIRTKGPDSIGQALTNQDTFVAALALEAREHGTTVINATMIDSVLGHLCPLYPIC